MSNILSLLATTFTVLLFMNNTNGFSFNHQRRGLDISSRIINSPTKVQLKSDDVEEKQHHNVNDVNVEVNQRRKFLSQIPIVLGTTTFMQGINVQSSTADDNTAALLESPSVAAPPVPTKPINTIEMKTFVDPKGLFILNVPKRFFAIRRTVKGDLPDEATGKGRRGSSIFTAGDMSKAEVIAVERFPTKVLLEEEGIDASGDLSTFTTIGNPVAIANLIALRRDRDKQTQARTIVIPNSVTVSEDGKTLDFSLSQSIDVQKPELLMEQMGVSELNRITLAKATLNSNDGQLMAVFASALEQDFNSVDGPALQESVESFVALSPTAK